MAYNFGCRAPCNLLWRASVVIRFNVTFLPLKPYCEKMGTCVLNDAESLTTYAYALWSSQNIYIGPYCLNTTIAVYFVSKCSDVKVFEGVRMP